MRARNGMCGVAAWAALAATPIGAAEVGAPEWLAGHWCQRTETGLIEEFWLAPVGGESLGLSRTVADGRSGAFEFIRLARVDGALTYLAQPSGRPPTAFAYADGGEDWIRFENPAHDFPQRIEYRRKGAGALEAEISGPGGNGTTQRVTYAYVACPGG